MPAESDKFVVATFALWAGDFEFAEELFRSTALTLRTITRHDRVESAEDLIRATAELRLRQLWQRRGEFRKLADEERGLVDVPLIIRGTHIRGTVWRTGERNFEMQAYLTDLSWERDLFARAREEYAKHQRIAGVERGEDQIAALADHLARGFNWSIVGNPMMEVNVTDLALIEVGIVWVSQELPRTSEELAAPLSGLIARLDGQ